MLLPLQKMSRLRLAVLLTWKRHSTVNWGSETGKPAADRPERPVNIGSVELMMLSVVMTKVDVLVVVGMLPSTLSRRRGIA